MAEQTMNSDPLKSDKNNVRTPPLGSYAQAKRQARANAALSTPDKKVPDNFAYTREMYRDAKKENIMARQAEGQNASAFGDFMTTGAGAKLAGIASMGADLGSQFIETQAAKGKNATGFDTQQQIGNALLQSGNPYAMAAGAAYKVLSGVAEATGGNINTIKKDQAKEVGMSGFARVANNVLGILHPGAGWLVNETTEGQKSHLIDEMSNAYSDAVSDIDMAGQLGGSKFLFGRNKIQNHIDVANRNNQILTEMNLTNTQRKKSDYGLDLAQQNLNRYAGTNYMNMRAGKFGMKITELDVAKALLRNRIIEEDVSEIQKFAEGGSLMPSGKLHKELNHINELGEQYEDLTRKGIPVVTLDEGGSLSQVAEVEKDEWIWNLEFTQQIEALWKDGSEEAMIEAGKLLTEELLRNTDDISGIIHKEDE